MQIKHIIIILNLSHKCPYRLFAGEKWADLCGAHRWPAEYFYFYNPLSLYGEKVHAQFFSTGML